MSETIPVRFDVLHAYAEANKLDYNELCRTVRDAIGAADELLELVESFGNARARGETYTATCLRYAIAKRVAP